MRRIPAGADVLIAPINEMPTYPAAAECEIRPHMRELEEDASACFVHGVGPSFRLVRTRTGVVSRRALFIDPTKWMVLRLHLTGQCLDSSEFAGPANTT